ncbi:hypothetical protein ABFS82_13G060700 [Erythranthe guttata]|uniref:F-box protein At3g07870-like isoform X2 n=1 Tax=Erythranthe guttata TaxID=4155 RepID=UPI00064DB1F3|nr:PREDICTED: F-box protein At3g07870-like isoform X2 [Erythranthe guttata]|eukprot:XP_012836490.1 PREDICTED: F-box protein At3g07870-like isoform X2 [Erythranthe guttata]
MPNSLAKLFGKSLICDDQISEGQSVSQPPPPSSVRRTVEASSLMDPNSNSVLTEDAADSKMVGGECNHACVSRRIRHYYSRRRKTNMESLPDELVFQILLDIAAQDIYKGARFVCKKWYDIIHSRNFIYRHLHCATPGLLFQSYKPLRRLVFVAMHNGRIKISKFSYKFRRRALSSCNGLIVESDLDDIYALYIVNPATKQRLALPPVSLPTITHKYYAIAYAAASMHYKVVLVHPCRYKTSTIWSCAILTVGVDESWRLVNIDYLSVKSTIAFTCAPLTTEGFIHWVNSKCTHVVTFNVETETIKETPVPDGYGDGVKHYLSTGSSLTLFIPCGEYSWEVLKMKPETGEWTKLFEIDLESQKGKFEHLVSECRPRPGNSSFILELVGWLNYEEVLVLRGSSVRVYILYNVGVQEIDFFELDYSFCYSSFNVHRNSLVYG